MASYPMSQLLTKYCWEPLLSPDSTPKEIEEALKMWGMPEEAYPADGNFVVNYKLTSSPRLPAIHVHLLRQAFATKPVTQNHSFFSFFNTQEFPIGPVDNPFGIGTNVQHRGYNHSSATLALGEAKLLAGWEHDVFAVEWTQQFQSTKELNQPFPPILSNFIFVTWPSLSLCLGPNMEPGPEYQDPDEVVKVGDEAKTEYPKSTDGWKFDGWKFVDGVQWLQPDLLHAIDHGLANANANDEVAREVQDQLNQCDEVPELVEEVRDEQSSVGAYEGPDPLQLLQPDTDDVVADGEESNSSVATFQDPSLAEWNVIGRDYDI